MTAEEQETLISWDRTDALAVYYTADPTQARKVERAGLKPIQVDIDPEDGKPRGWRYELPKSWVRVRVGPPIKRQLTEASREKLRENMRKAREAKKQERV